MTRPKEPVQQTRSYIDHSDHSKIAECSLDARNETLPSRRDVH
jgi:hypothetical protein